MEVERTDWPTDGKQTKREGLLQSAVRACPDGIGKQFANYLMLRCSETSTVVNDKELRSNHEHIKVKITL